MERIDLYVKNMWETIKVNGSKVILKPMISTSDMMGIAQLCVNQFETIGGEMSQLPLIKTIFDMMVVHYCSNIRVRGVVSDVRKRDEIISISVDKEEIEEFDNSLAILHIKPYIKNYDECFSLLLKILELHNVNSSIVRLGNALPDAETMGEDIKKALETVQEVKEKDPETFNKIVEESITKTAREKAQKEVKEAKKKNKTK